MDVFYPEPFYLTGVEAPGVKTVFDTSLAGGKWAVGRLLVYPWLR